MTIPSEFTLFHYGQEIVMFHNCILDLVTNIVISYIVFVSDIQKPWIATLFILLSSLLSHLFLCLPLFLVPFTQNCLGHARGS